MPSAGPVHAMTAHSSVLHSQIVASCMYVLLGMDDIEEGLQASSCRLVWLGLQVPAYLLGACVPHVCMRALCVQSG